MRVAWAITGAGHFLRLCVELILELEEVDVFLSLAGREVLRMYHLESRLGQGMGEKGSIFNERSASSPVVGRFARGEYDVLVAAPATSNSVAKFVFGISDSLVSNLFAQAGKSRVPILVMPTDVSTEVDSDTPDGGVVKVYPRSLDLDNTARLRVLPGVFVVDDVQALRRCLFGGRFV